MISKGIYGMSMICADVGRAVHIHSECWGLVVVRLADWGEPWGGVGGLRMGLRCDPSELWMRWIKQGRREDEEE